MINDRVLQSQSGEPSHKTTGDVQYAWLSPARFAQYLVANCSNLPPLKGSPILHQLAQMSGHDDLSSQQLFDSFSAVFTVESLNTAAYTTRDLEIISPCAFIRFDDQYLPLEACPRVCTPEDFPAGARFYFLNDQLPKRKLNKFQFIQAFLAHRYSKLGLLFLLGSIPVVLVAISELFNQPLFDSIVPSGHIPAIFLIGVATIFFQGSGQILTSIGQQAQVVFNGQVDLASKLATAERFLKARSQDLPVRDIGSWRLTFSVASAFLGSLESLVISIPLAIFSLFVNLIVIGAYSDLSAVEHLLLICLVPAFLSLLISYISSTIAIKMMGQQSRLESIIFSVVKNIRGIWMSNTEPMFIHRFFNARMEMARSLLRSGTFAASTDILDKLSTGLLYAYIYIEYYRSTTATSAHHASVGSLLVIYSAVGTVGGALNSITSDLVTIFQTLPTYWTPNAIRDINSFVQPVSTNTDLIINSIIVENLTYQAPGLRGPFDKPIGFELHAPGAIAITGPSGSGKSTLLKILMGHIKPTAGRLSLIDGFGNDSPLDLYQSDILVLSQEIGLFGDQLRDVVDPAGVLDDELIEMVAHKAGLTQILDQLPLRWQTPVNEYSRDLSLGQLQLFKLAKALTKRHHIIFSDEPTCHLPEAAHLDALKLLNDHCDLHVSVLHRKSALSQFKQVLSISTSGVVTLTEVNLS